MKPFNNDFQLPKGYPVAIEKMAGPVIKVNHGPQFGHKEWWTFCCPKCKAQVTRQETENRLCKCGFAIAWGD